jgi:hypothetical protein
MTLVVKAERRAAPRRRQAAPKPPVASASPQARRQAATILEVLAGVRRPCEAAQVLEISLPRYYQLEQRALAGLVTACEPAPRGPRVDLTRRIAALERDKGRLQRECDRQQALVRAAQRSLGLTLPVPPKSPVANKEAAANSSGKRRRHRRPSVRALKAVRALQVEEVAPTGEQAEVATPTSAGN